MCYTLITSQCDSFRLVDSPRSQRTRRLLSEKIKYLAATEHIHAPLNTIHHGKWYTLDGVWIHAIDTYLHGKRRPIANTPPADQAGSSRAQLQTILSHLRRSQRPGGPPAADENARIAEARRRTQALLIDLARNADVLLIEIPFRYELNSPVDIGSSEY